MAKSKDVLTAALKAILASAETSVLIKIPATFIAELASLPKDKRDALDTMLPSEQFEELLTQSELSTTNTALAAVGTEQIKKLVANLIELSDKQIETLSELTQEEFDTISKKLEIIDANAVIAVANTEIIKADVKKLLKLTETIGKLEEKLAQSPIPADSGGQQVPQPTQEAKDLAAHIEDDAGPYAQALKAIAEGNNKKADGFLDETQQFWDIVQQRKDEVQAKIYMARIQNALYAGRGQETLEYYDKLTTLAGNDLLILNKVNDCLECLVLEMFVESTYKQVKEE